MLNMLQQRPVINTFCSIALGHNRLAIVDLNPEGEQPFHDAEGNIHAVVNGELYGYEEIREALSREGYKFKSRSDSEIALALYKKHGLSLLHSSPCSFIRLCRTVRASGPAFSQQI